MSKKKPYSRYLKEAKETQIERKERVSNGIKFRSSVMKDKKDKRQNPSEYSDDILLYFNSID